MFNEEQQKAIETIKGQLILVACPGSGKTTTLLGRIHEMIQQGVPAENILMVTFTTAAAGEMKQRFWKKYAEDGMVTFCTIHSFCLATLKKFAHFDAECVLATGDIYEFFFQQLVRHKEIVDKVEYIKALLLDIAVCKNSMCPLAQFEPNCGEKELFDELFKAYENWKDALGKIDYDDMLLKAYELMKNDKTCLEWLQERYQYIQIDEFQDTNYLQRDILYLLAGENGNIAVVGDDDQSIYGFRGAKPEIMLKFSEHYPNAVSLHLSTNYRSDRKIIECASNLIHHNKERFDKEFLASHEEEGIVHHQTYNDIDAEQRGLVKMILEKKMSMEEYRNTSILYRTNKEPYIEDGVQVYVNPIAVNIMERGEVSFHEFVEQNNLDHDMQNMLLSTGFFALSERDIWQHLEKEIEFSNQIFLDGQLCREPVFQPGGEKGKPPSMIQFQIASNRKRRIVEDGVDKKTDYVWIKAYGLKAAEYAAALHIHSNVSINGAIQTRSYVKEYECPYCGQISKIAYLAVEVIPYSIEYGANCTLPDPQERGEESDETDEISGSFDSESD